MSWAITAVAVVTAVGAGVSAYGQYQSGQAQEDMAKYNAKIQADAANNEAQAGAENARRQREENRRRLATMRTRIAGSGVNIGAGSSLDVLGEAAGELELQALDVFRDSDARQRQLKSQSVLTSFEGKQASRAGTIGATGTLISGLGQAGSMMRTGNA